MTILDAYALIAALRDEPARVEVERLLRNPEDRAHVAAVNLAEVLDQMVRVAGWEVEPVRRALDLLAAGGLVALDTDRRLALLAGQVRATFYDMRTCQVSLADCVAVSTAQNAGQSLATSDPHLAHVARELAVEVVALPDSSGKRP